MTCKHMADKKSDEAKQASTVIDYKTTSWIYTLNKKNLLNVLAVCAEIDPNIQFNSDDSIENLRKVLATHVKTTHKLTVKDKEQNTSSGEDSELNVNIEKLIIRECVEMSTNANTLAFKLGEDDWELYAERLELYFEANDIPENKQVAVLLTKISPDTYKLVRNLCAPDKPKYKTHN